MDTHLQNILRVVPSILKLLLEINGAPRILRSMELYTVFSSSDLHASARSVFVERRCSTHEADFD